MRRGAALRRLTASPLPAEVRAARFGVVVEVARDARLLALVTPARLGDGLQRMSRCTPANGQ